MRDEYEINNYNIFIENIKDYNMHIHRKQTHLNAN